MNLANHADMADVEQTLLHEIVGHRGLRAELMLPVWLLRMRLIKQFLAPASSWLDVVWFKVFPL